MTMKKQNKKSLSLDTQTLRSLDGAPLSRAAGGYGGNTNERTWCLPCGGPSSGSLVQACLQ
jgi:hypothetical protein